jgi:hypothetical protein
MKTTVLLSALAVLTFSLPAFADYAPKTRPATREEVSASCASLGAAGKGWGLEAATGDFGCQNTVNGNALACTADGNCTDHAGDPRWSRIQMLLKGANGGTAPAKRLPLQRAA